MTELTTAGFVRTRLDERLADLQAAARAIFGADMDLGSDTMDGQHLALFAERIADLDELAEQVWQSFDPAGSAGLSLGRLVQLNGISRSLGAPSTVELTLTGTDGTIIPAGSLVANASGTIVVATDSAVTIAGGVATVMASTLQDSTLSSSAGTLTVIRSPLYGWLSVTNSSAMLPGALPETDLSLRQRRNRSVSLGNRNVVDALWAALADLPSVTEAVVLENATALTDSRGLPPHSIHAVVQGGASNDIAQTIWQRKTAGTVLAGSTTITVLDAQGHAQPVRFSRPVAVRAIARVTVSPRSGWGITTVSQIKNALAQWVAANQSVGDELTPAELYTPLNVLAGFVTVSIELARFSSGLDEAALPVAFDERIGLDIADITVVTS